MIAQRHFFVFSAIHPQDISRKDVKAIDAIKDMLKMTHLALLDNADAATLKGFDDTTFTFDPENKHFQDDTETAAFRKSNKTSTTIFVGRNILEFKDRSQEFTYHKATFRGGDSPLLFVGLHEYGHIYGRRLTHGQLRTGKELFANDFTKQYFPERVIGYRARRRHISFPD